MSKSKHQSIRLFKNPILESLSHVHPSMPFIIWIPVVLYLLYVTVAKGELSLPLIAGVFLGGVLFWTLAEYSLHRFVFHYDAKTKAGKYLVFLFHGIHHDDPVDPTRLVFPPVAAIPLAMAFYYLFKVTVGEGPHVPFFCGFMTGYMAYDFIHFSVHHFQPKTKVGRFLKENHMKHHYIKHGAKWGVSSPFWDHIFRTHS